MVGGCDAVIVTSVTREVGRDASDVIANHNDIRVWETYVDRMWYSYIHL